MKTARLLLPLAGLCFVGSAAAITAAAQKLWDPGQNLTIAFAAALPVSYAFLVRGLASVRARMQERKKSGPLVLLAHLTCLLATCFVIVYALWRLGYLPRWVLLIPAFPLAFGWLVIFPLSIVAVVRSRLWLDLLPIPAYLMTAVAGIPVMVYMMF
jgi:hypothetical protein